MKTIYLISFFLCSFAMFAQNEDVTFVQTNVGATHRDNAFVERTASGTRSGRNFQSASDIIGEKFLFDEWNSEAIVATKSGGFLRIINLNFDKELGTFFYVEAGKAVELDQFLVKNLTINGRIFKRTKNALTNVSRIMEVLYETDEIAILLDHRVNVIKGRVDKFRGTTRDYYVDVTKFYKVKDEEFTELNINNRGLNKLFGSFKDEMNAFISNNNLSYQNIDDLYIIFNKLKALRILADMTES